MAHQKDQSPIHFYRFTQAHEAHTNLPGILQDLGGRLIPTLSGPVNEPHRLDLKNNEGQVTIFKNGQWVSTGITAQDGDVYEGEDLQNGDIKCTFPVVAGDTLLIFYGRIFFTEEPAV